ncbi:hypothetical protein N7524_006742 [Penicillium chrysogenum]|nr:hypothetical protein N7524_006742 [Penicillium chrysogenum]
MPSEPATLSGFPANLTVTVTLLDAKHPPAARHRQHSRRLLRPRSGHEPAETTVGDNVALDSTTGALDMDAGLTRSTVLETSCAENRPPVAGGGAGLECIGAVRRTKTKEVF